MSIAPTQYAVGLLSNYVSSAKAAGSLASELRPREARCREPITPFR
jgi:hypothetical protein